METSAETFYRSYIKEYHEVRALYLQKLLSEIDSVNEYLSDNQLTVNGVNVPLQKNTKFIIQADIRQNYFHAIETFFEFFFAFLPSKGKIPDNGKIVRQLVKSNWRKNYKRIEYISDGSFKINLLNQNINFAGYTVSVGHYLFYPGTFAKEKFDESYLKSVNESLESIEKGIKILADDFSRRGEYNAYKHTMRVFPTYETIQFLDVETMSKKIEFDLTNSASYQEYNDRENETSVKTKVFDPERDIEMTIFCSRLIYNMIELRNIMFNKNNIQNQNEVVGIILFNKSNITELSKHNVEIQDLVFSTKKEH